MCKSQDGITANVKLHFFLSSPTHHPDPYPYHLPLKLNQAHPGGGGLFRFVHIRKRPAFKNRIFKIAIWLGPRKQRIAHIASLYIVVTMAVKKYYYVSDTISYDF